MPNVLVFTPQHKLDYRKNYDDFIDFAKNELTLFDDCEFKSPTGMQQGWLCDKWFWMTPRGKKLTIVFGKSESHSKYITFKSPFSDFARAYVRYQQSLNHKDSVMWASSLVWIHDSLEEFATQNKKSTVDIMDLNNSAINDIETKLKNSGMGAGGKRNIALSLESVLKFIQEKRMKLDLLDWKNPFPRTTDAKIKLDKKSRQIEEDKCPSDYQMMQFADAFHRAKSPRQKYFTSLCVMLMCQPSRSVELKGLTIHSLQKSSEGRWFLMWNPAKGGDPVKKWIPKLLEDVVRQAFKNLIDISAPARKSAQFAYDNPGVFMHHEACSTPEGFPQNRGLTYSQLANAMGFQTGIGPNGRKITWNNHTNLEWLNNIFNRLNNTSNWRKELLDGLILTASNEVFRKNSKTLIDVDLKFPKYMDIRTVVDEQYMTEGFPYYGGALIWECITVIREHEFHKQFLVKPFSWGFVGHGMLSDAIGSERVNDQSIFDELGIIDEDDSPLRLNTHQFRHWLNTKLQLAGEEDWFIAKWSGRADVEQNKAYDGRTPEQRSRLTKRIGSVTDSQSVMTIAQVDNFLSVYSSETPPPAIVLHDLKLPVSLKSLGIDRSGVAQFTGLGYCAHNYAESPCIKNSDCVACSEHVCLKGLPHTLEELKNLERLLEEQLEGAKVNAEDLVFGADRWVTALGFRLIKVKTIINMLEDPKNPDGSAVIVPSVLDPSPVKRAFGINELDALHEVRSSSIKQAALPSPAFDLAALALSDLEEF
jgi:hypothetical protein